MFGAEIKPYLKYMKIYQESKGLPQREILEKIRDIFDQYVKDERLPKTSLGCGNCIHHMMGQLIGAIDRLGNEPIKLEPKIPHLKPQPIESEIERKEIEEEDSNELTLDQLRALCDENGIKYHHRAGRKKLNELLGFS